MLPINSLCTCFQNFERSKHVLFPGRGNWISSVIKPTMHSYLVSEPGLCRVGLDFFPSLCIFLFHRGSGYSRSQSASYNPFSHVVNYSRTSHLFIMEKKIKSSCYFSVPEENYRVLSSGHCCGLQEELENLAYEFKCLIFIVYLN